MLERTCPQCGRVFDATPKGRVTNPPKKFCSRRCINHSRGKKPIPSAEFFQRPCELCGKIFDATPSRPTYEPPKRFCVECFFKGRGVAQHKRLDRICGNCGKAFQITPSVLRKGSHRGMYCSRECTYEHWRSIGGVHPTRKANGEKGRLVNGQGYVEIYISKKLLVGKDRPSTSRFHGGWILEHRFVMEQIIGRPLLKTENVHHKDGNRANNAPENLELWIKPQPTGIRAVDLVLYVVTYHRSAVETALLESS